MAKFIPDGWRCSRQGELRFNELYSVIELIVGKQARKYDLPSKDRNDLMQEGRLAASYAVDTYDPIRGRIEGYIARVVSNALAMVAAEALALSRQPYKMVQESDGSWRRVPVRHVEIEHEIIPDKAIDHHVSEQSLHRAELLMSVGPRLEQLCLGDDARAILTLRLDTPAELWILSRNLNRGRTTRIDPQAICYHLDWVINGRPDRLRHQRAAKELRDKFKIFLGIDDVTFNSLPHKEVDTIALMRGAKSRTLEAACCS